MIRTLELGLAGSSSSKIPPVRCTVAGCHNSTREQKPWCSDHVLGHSPLALDQQAELEARELEARTGRIRLDGTLVREVLQLVHLSHVTLGRLPLHVPELSAELAKRYVGRLARLGLVQVKRTRRWRAVEGLVVTEAGLEVLGEGH